MFDAGGVAVAVPVDGVWSLACLDSGLASVEQIAVGLGDLTVVLRWLQSVEVRLLQRLEVLADVPGSGVDPDVVTARATGRSVAAAVKATKRARAAVTAPALSAAIARGELGVEHLDAFTSAVASLPAALRPRLLELESELAAEAVRRQLTAEAFRDRLRDVCRGIEGDDGRSRLERQKRETGLRAWTGRDGMWCLAGRFDPATALSLQQRLADQLEARFRQARPADCPDDPLLAQDWLRAHALADLVNGLGAAAGAPEVIVVIDQDTFERGRHEGSRVDCGCPGLEVPVDWIHDLAGRARFVPVIIDRDGVMIAQGRPVPSYAQLARSLSTPVELDHGRTRRHASRAQRRALRAMYRRCAIPGCDRHVSLTEPHHLRFWEHGGGTDLSNLLPLCKHHHDRLHAEQWDVQMAPDRSLVVRRNGEVIMTTGPPTTQWA